MITKKFSKSFDEVLIQAYLFQSEFVADQTEFTALSPLFASPFADDFLSDIEAADAIPTNEDDLNFQTFHTQEVEDQMVLARAHYQKLLYYVGLAYPDSETILKLFGNNQYERARYTPLKMSNLLQNAYDMANSTTYKATLIATGFLQTDITLLNTLDADLTAKIKIQQDFIKHSVKRSEDRAVAFNKVWDTMVKISNASKLIFKDSPAKIEFYLLYPEGAGPGSLTAPTNLSFYFPTKTISWDAVDNATSYQLQWSIDGDEANYVEIYSGSDTSFTFDAIASPLNYLRARARNNNGFGDWSDVLIQGYFVTLPPPIILGVDLVPNSSNSVRVVWEEVPSATKYRVYRSTVNIGDPAGAWVLVSQVTSTTTYIDTVTESKRYYYRLTAENSYQASVVSANVFVDVDAAP